ncbi:MAG: DUF5719 family protein [Actinomycetota bacterium]
MIRVRRLLAVILALGAMTSLVVLDKVNKVTLLTPLSTERPGKSHAVPIISTELKLTTSWFCPGVPANDAAITGVIIISNSSDSDITGTITLLSSEQQPVISALSVPARSSVALDAIAGIESKFVSAVVELNGDIGSVEQQIVHPAGDSVALCANAPSKDWFFADGFTGADSVEQVVLTNPFTDSTIVDISFVTLETKREPATLQGFVLPPRSVTVVSMDEQGARNEKVLAVSVRASSGRFIAGRSQHYLGQGRLGYTMSLGASTTSPQWWFPDGEKNANVAEQLVIFNPGDTDRTLSVIFITNGDAASGLEPATITAPAGRVVTLNTASLPTLPDGRYGILVAMVETSADQTLTALGVTDTVDNIVVEQVINRGDGKSVGTSVVLGVPTSAASTTWVAPSGATAGLDGTFVVLNTTADSASISVESVGPAGAVALSGLESIVMPASGLVTITLPVGLPVGELILRATVPVIVERLLGRGHDLVGRSTVMALPLIPSPVTVS